MMLRTGSLKSEPLKREETGGGEASEKVSRNKEKKI